MTFPCGNRDQFRSLLGRDVQTAFRTLSPLRHRRLKNRLNGFIILSPIRFLGLSSKTSSDMVSRPSAVSSLLRSAVEGRELHVSELLGAIQRLDSASRGSDKGIDRLSDILLVLDGAP